MSLYSIKKKVKIISDLNFNSFSEVDNLGYSKFKALADDNFNVSKNVFGRFEKKKTCEKRRRCMLIIKCSCFPNVVHIFNS